MAKVLPLRNLIGIINKLIYYLNSDSLDLDSKSRYICFFFSTSGLFYILIDLRLDSERPDVKLNIRALPVQFDSLC